MDARVKKMWVEALRSGKWRKAKGQLRKSTNYRCCLGVLDEVYMEDTDRGAWMGCGFTGRDRIPKSEGSYHGHGDAYLGVEGCLDRTVMEWAGLTHIGGNNVTIGGEDKCLAHHNDGYECKPKSQLEIADAIEGQL